MPTTPDPARGQPRAFEELYLGSRRRLLLQAYALTGDLAVARSAVVESFVAARQHWRKVGRLPDPEEWVRPRVWATAERRHVARLWHRERGIAEDQRAVLAALHHLSEHQRRRLLLVTLAGLSPVEVGRELGESTARAEQRLDRAVRAFCEETGTPLDGVTETLESLAPVAEAAALPGVATLHRHGGRRRVLRGAVGTAVVLALCLVGGMFVVREQAPLREAGATAKDAEPSPVPVSEAMLLDAARVSSLDRRQRWRLLSTSDNTAGAGINSVCQDQRFADPRGSGTFVRTFAAAGTPRRRLVQTVEVSRSPRAAAGAYRTTLGWFAGCREARLQLLGAFRVGGVGEQAQLLLLRIPNRVRRSYVVGLVRSGSLTVSTVLETVGGGPVPVARAATVLTAAARQLCAADPAGPCPTRTAVAPVLPPPSGEAPGTLAAADLPVVGRIDRPWVGTRPVPARPNVAATPCDRTSFVAGGARRPMSRVFLVPQARLPRRFGITETYGAFATRARATALVAGVRRAMATCEKRELGARVSQAEARPDGYRGSELYLWRLDSEISKGTTVGFWMGVARVGRYVAQVSFTPVGADDVDADTFSALVARARDRLFELTGRSR
jgi:DNA-directed RNA polymerase specialized sigma24 family protein